MVAEYCFAPGTVPGSVAARARGAGIATSGSGSVAVSGAPRDHLPSYLSLISLALAAYSALVSFPSA